MSLFSIVTSCMPAQTVQQSSLIIYGDFHPEKVKDREYVIVEPVLFSPEDVSVLKSQNKKVLAYISLGEVNEGATNYSQLKSETLSFNPIWNSYVIDIEAPNTRQALMDKIEMHLEQQGFDGLFLDNIDNYTSFGPTPHKKEALISFLRDVKSRFRESVLLQNAGLQIIGDTQPYVDAIALESVASDYNFDQNKYRLRSETGFKERMGNIQKVLQENELPFLLIEYADTKALQAKILKRLKNYRLPVFIGQIDLQKIPEFK